jgi:predicted TIM-barrel fold metal-dependent hydrolase
MLLPFNHPDVAAGEMRIAKEEHGLNIVFTNPTPPDDRAWSDPDFEVLWRTAEELDVVVTFHESTVGAGPNSVGINRYTGRSPMIYLCTHTVEVQLAVMDLILGGVLERHPRLHVGLLEAHLTWIPGWLELMDFKFGAALRQTGVLRDDPSTYFRRQIFAAAFPDDPGVREVADAVGVENVVFSSDWPHPNLVPGANPNWVDVVNQRSDITEAEKTRMLEENPRRWLHL